MVKYPRMKTKQDNSLVASEQPWLKGLKEKELEIREYCNPEMAKLFLMMEKVFRETDPIRLADFVVYDLYEAGIREVEDLIRYLEISKDFKEPPEIITESIIGEAYSKVVKAHLGT
jgi:hypothetical protein